MVGGNKQITVTVPDGAQTAISAEPLQEFSNKYAVNKITQPGNQITQFEHLDDIKIFPLYLSHEPMLNNYQSNYASLLLHIIYPTGGRTSYSLTAAYERMGELGYKEIWKILDQSDFRWWKGSGSGPNQHDYREYTFGSYTGCNQYVDRYYTFRTSVSCITINPL